MAKVEMSLQEYNAMKEELDRAREIIAAITTPYIDEWDLNYWKEDSERTLSFYNNMVKNLRSSTRDYLVNEITMNINNLNIKGEFNVSLGSTFLGVMKHVKEETHGCPLDEDGFPIE